MVIFVKEFFVLPHPGLSRYRFPSQERPNCYEQVSDPFELIPVPYGVIRCAGRHHLVKYARVTSFHSAPGGLRSTSMRSVFLSCFWLGAGNERCSHASMV